MATIHIVLQGKGGVGKSYISSLLTQFYQSQGVSPICIDTDPVNASFSAYKAYKVERIELMEENNINVRQFDTLIERLAGTKEDDTVIIDNGAATFIPLCSYIFESGSLQFLEEMGHDLTLHTVVTGGQSLNDTMQGMASLIHHFKGMKITVWLNEYFGKIEKNGVKFENTDFFQDNAENIYSVVPLPLYNQATFGVDIAEVVKNNLSYQEAIESPQFAVMSKHRLKRVQTEIFSSIERAL
jgi:hypothetical protein